MADFRTHVTTSSVLGIGYAGMGIVSGMEIESAIVGGGLCGVSGMLPDLDSNSGIPIREATGFAAGIVPMLLVDRFRSIGMPYDRMVLITAILYFVIRFAGAQLLGRFTVHRGMFHSIPAGLIFAGLAFLICGPADEYQVRYFKAGAVFFGFMSHLFLDELYSIQWQGGTWRLKRSFGTAIKLWGKNGWANFSTYTKLTIVAVMVASEPSVMSYLEERYPELADRVQRINEAQDELVTNVRDRVHAGSETPNETTAANHSTTPDSSSATANWLQPGRTQSSQPTSYPTPNSNPPSNFRPSSVEEDFKPNAGQPDYGTARPFYRASTTLPQQ
ncbi:metal-dependent hydrolase [Aeoliella mucimassa]|uniref:Inner membrane protein n=1 Tax=Aeoliella mucimassa TaxID=2527972 RepID=A0A518AMB6_9BACT|nr:metal-dependent hydrolase [Aeoliella mucimassa]QDU55864.1 hypothetical protein Pan181_20610 [Aeoliella mucimassa]